LKKIYSGNQAGILQRVLALDISSPGLLLIFGFGYELDLILLFNEATYYNFTVPQNNIVMEGIIFIPYFGLALLVGVVGKNRIIGFGMAFVSALF
jgi:hypothetical protein